MVETLAIQITVHKLNLIGAAPGDLAQPLATVPYGQYLTFYHGLLLSFCPIAAQGQTSTTALKTTNYSANDSGLANTYKHFFLFTVIHLEAYLGFLLSIVNTHCFTKKKMEPCLGIVYAEENRYFLQLKSNYQKLEGTVRAHQIHALLGQTERSSKYPGQ